MVKKQFLIFLTLLFFDQVSKIIVNTTNLSIDFKILAITLVKNTGAIWGSFKDSNVAFIWISLIAVGVLMHSYDEFPKKSYPFLLLLFAGVIGNLIDRLFRGYVIDFINFIL